MFEHFNGPARRALLLAFREARRRQHDFLGTEHVLFGLLCESDSPVAAILRGLQQSPEIVQNVLDEEMPDETGAALEQFPLSPALRRAFQFAGEEAAQLGQTVIGPDHLLLGLLREDESEAAQLLAGFGLTLEQVRRAIRQQPASENREHLLQAQPRPFAGSFGEPTAAELAGLIAELVPVSLTRTSAETKTTEGTTSPDITLGAAAGTAHQLADVEVQLRNTQLVLGGVLGFFFGHLVGGWELGVLAALGGVCLALLRSSGAGAWMGFLAGCIFLPGFIGDVEEPLIGKYRLLLGAVGALLGSFLGDFWRRPQRLLPNSPPTRARE